MLCNRYPWKYSVIAAVGIEPSYMVLLLLVNEPAMSSSEDPWRICRINCEML